MLRSRSALAWLAPALLLASLGKAVADAPKADVAPHPAAAKRPAAAAAPKAAMPAAAPAMAPAAKPATAPAAKPAMDADRAAPAAPKGVKTYSIDPVHSSAEFAIHHILGRVPGRFHDMAGTITVDAAQVAQAKASVTIPTATIDTDNEKRDGHLKSADFFEVEKYPDMKFEATSVELRGASDAVVHGNLTRSGTIEAPIGRHPESRTRMAVVARGKPAVTHYRVVARYAGGTLLCCRLETGRTHQIRVHLASIGHPIVGDPVYGKRVGKGNVPHFHRQALHAQKLGLVHPQTREPMSWEAPLPADMRELITQFEAHG